MGVSVEKIECQWCHGQSDAGSSTCVICGAPLDERNKVSDSGWREAPRLRDMTQIRFGRSTCQVEGEIVPVAELTLGQGDAVYFEQHVMLWKDEHVPLQVMNTPSRSIVGGMPHVVMIAGGPGRIAYSRDQTGELVVLPMHPNMEIDVREHAFLLASTTVNYSFVQIKGLTNVLRGGSGMFMDRFVTGQYGGMLMLHGYGDVFERILQPGEKMYTEPGAFLYKDSTVQMNAVKTMKLGMMRSLWMAEFVGPGRLGIQSMYHHHG